MTTAVRVVRTGVAADRPRPVSSANDTPTVVVTGAPSGADARRASPRGERGPAGDAGQRRRSRHAPVGPRRAHQRPRRRCRARRRPPPAASTIRPGCGSAMPARPSGNNGDAATAVMAATSGRHRADHATPGHPDGPQLPRGHARAPAARGSRSPRLAAWRASSWPADDQADERQQAGQDPQRNRLQVDRVLGVGLLHAEEEGLVGLAVAQSGDTGVDRRVRRPRRGRGASP